MLLSRNIPVIFVRFFAVWYTSQQFKVRWNCLYSQSFKVSNGVRQGGILSPIFFNMYMDKLSSKLNTVKVGCIVNETVINHLIYADDSVLFAYSARALQVLLSHCEEFP